MELVVTEEAIAKIRAKGGTASIDFLPPDG